MGIDTMYHAIHAFGLAELLKSGNVSNVDDEHYWNLIDNTYIDDVSLLLQREDILLTVFLGQRSNVVRPPISI